MRSKEVTIGLASGLEARPAAMLVQVASQYNCSIYLENGDKSVNAKSIMGMMALTLDQGMQVTIYADGKDENAAVEEMESYLTC